MEQCRIVKKKKRNKKMKKKFRMFHDIRILSRVRGSRACIKKKNQLKLKNLNSNVVFALLLIAVLQFAYEWEHWKRKTE